MFLILINMLTFKFILFKFFFKIMVIANVSVPNIDPSCQFPLTEIYVSCQICIFVC